MPLKQDKKNNLYTVLWSMIGLYITFFSVVSFLKYRAFSYNDFDLAIHAQTLWNIWHSSIYSSILGIDFLGNHSHLIIFLLAPVYKLFPHPFTLLFLQSCALGVAAYPVFLLARTFFSSRLAVVISLLYLLYPALGYVNLFEFHPTVFATLFLSFSLLYFIQNKFIKFLIFTVLSLLCQENIALVFIMLGIYALILRRSYKWVLIPLLTGGAYFIFCAAFLMPHFNKNTVQFLSIYGHLGKTFPEIIINIITHPVGVLRIIFGGNKLIYLMKLFAPLIFLPFIHPLSLILVLPFLMQHLLSLRGTETTIYYHYAAEMIPFIFLSFILALNFLFKQEKIKKYKFIIISAAVVSTVIFNLTLGPYLRVFKGVNDLKRDALDMQKEILLKQVPDGAAVVTTFEFLPRLANRKELYSFHHVYLGFYTLSNKPYILPENTAYALLDVNDLLTFRDFYHPQRFLNFKRFIDTGNWGVVEAKDTLVFLKKNTPNSDMLYELLSARPEVKQGLAVDINNEVVFLGFDLISKEAGLLNLNIYWQSIKRTQIDLNLFFDFIDERGQLMGRVMRPLCYRIFPSQAWSPGQFIREKKEIFYPAGLPAGAYTVKMGFFNYTDGQLCAVTPRHDPLGRVFITQIEIK